MKKEELRKVKFSIRTSSGFNIFDGYFHQWGLTSESSGNETYYNVSVGIVEDKKGLIHLPYPANISFID